MTPASTELLLRVNGIQAAFGIEFGLASPRAEEGRATDPYRQANTSFSLVQRRDGQIVRHTLIDVGMGVLPSLLEFEQTHGVHVVHEVVLTHPHFDHFAQLDFLSMALQRNGRPDQPRPLPIYASPLCWAQGPCRVFPWLAERDRHIALEPGSVITLGDLQLTAFGVDHGPGAPGALGFVARHGEKTIVFSGDFLHLPAEVGPWLQGADACFLDANTWHPAPRTWHQSVLGDLDLLRRWRPRRAYLVHYSGYEDREHLEDPIHEPLERAAFKRELSRACPDLDVQLACHGMVLGDDTPWPGPVAN